MSSNFRGRALITKWEKKVYPEPLIDMVGREAVLVNQVWKRHTGFLVERDFWHGHFEGWPFSFQWRYRSVIYTLEYGLVVLHTEVGVSIKPQFTCHCSSSHPTRASEAACAMTPVLERPFISHILHQGR